MRIIDAFRGEYRFLSNFYPCEISYERILYPSVEHAFQAAKSTDINVRRRICAANTAMVAKFMGNNIKLRPLWDDIKVSIMLVLIRKKFRDSELRRKLLATGTAKLIEGNTWNDTFWGVCKGEGKNQLGRILMVVRDEVK